MTGFISWNIQRMTTCKLSLVGEILSFVELQYWRPSWIISLSFLYRAKIWFYIQFCYYRKILLIQNFVLSLSFSFPFFLFLFLSSSFFLSLFLSLTLSLYFSLSFPLSICFFFSSLSPPLPVILPRRRWKLCSVYGEGNAAVLGLGHNRLPIGHLETTRVGILVPCPVNSYLVRAKQSRWIKHKPMNSFKIEWIIRYIGYLWMQRLKDKPI